MLLRMKCKQRDSFAWLCALSLSALGCQHEVAMGSTDTHTPKAEAAEPAAPVPAQPIAAPSGNTACTTDADCHTVDSYCGSCQCLALPTAATAPACAGDKVQCFAAPCRGQQAMCKAGSCTLSGGGSDM